MKPADYLLPHDNFRPYQEESIKWLSEQDRLRILEAATGSGKSSIAMSQSIYGQTVVTTKTKGLQDQYGKLYRDCVVLYGRRNYPCVLRGRAIRGVTTAEDCFFPDEHHDCPAFGNCPYFQQKARAHASSRVALNYAYWMTTHRTWEPKNLVMDEAHNLSDIVLDHVSMTISQRDITHWELPDVPEISSKYRNSMFFKSKEDIIEIALNWLTACWSHMASVVARLEQESSNEKNTQSKRIAQGLIYRLRGTIEALRNNPGLHWYIHSGQDALWNGAGFIARPLTARFDFARFFEDKPRSNTAMSATIGNPQAFADELGIKEFVNRSVPHQWPAESRQVEILDVPSMGHDSTTKNPSVWDKQADEIAKSINTLPPTWSGFVLVTRKTEANLLAARLAKRGLQDRVWVTPGADGTYVATNEQLRAWNERREKVPNSICLSFSFWEGVDAVIERFVYIAKAPFPMISSDYEKERMAYDPRFFLQRTAYELEQGAGRCRRGEPEDYNTDGKLNTYVAIADGSWNRVQNYLSATMQEAIVKP